MTENPYIDLIARGIEERGLVRTAFSGRSMAPTLTGGMLLAIERSDLVQLTIPNRSLNFSSVP